MSGYLVRHATDRAYLGRYTLTAALSFVPFAFAYVFESIADAEQARATVAAAADAVVVPLDGAK